ncbi:MAG TPA: hypothetical protein VF338_02520, partial [Leptolinea sp.]
MNLQLNKMLEWIKNNIANILVGIIIIGAINLRIVLYDDMRLSIATNDSSSYYSEVNLPLFSWESFTARRLPSYPIFFKIFEPINGYQEPKAVSYPAAPGVGTRNKALQPGFDSVALAQAILAIFSWVFFVIILCRRLRIKILRPIAAAMILLFAFSPSLAEWDSVIMSESISFSLFTILAAVSLELLFRIPQEKNKPERITSILLVIWMLLVPAWAFTRDSNANTLVILVGFFGFFLIIPRIRRETPIIWFSGILIWLVFLAYLYSITTTAANRWVWGWLDIYNHWISGNPARMKFFIDHGMPDPWTNEWVQLSGTKTY